MTFEEWFRHHQYSYADNIEQLKESCKMAWEAALQSVNEEVFAYVSNYPPLAIEPITFCVITDEGFLAKDGFFTKDFINAELTNSLERAKLIVNTPFLKGKNAKICIFNL